MYKTNIELTLSRTNIVLVMNKLLLRLKLEDLSDVRKEGIKIMLNDCEQVLETLKMATAEIDYLNKRILRIHTDNLKLKKEIVELTTKENLEI